MRVKEPGTSRTHANAACRSSGAVDPAETRRRVLRTRNAVAAADPSRIGKPFMDRYVVWESSGSSGEPAIFVQDAQAMAVYDALEALRRPNQRPWQRFLDPGVWRSASSSSAQRAVTSRARCRASSPNCTRTRRPSSQPIRAQIVLS